MKHLHFIGICGTFMGSLALLARSLGYKVTGCDANVYPPMSTLLAEQGVELISGYEADQVDLKPDLFIVGNVAKRGMPVIEALLNQKRPYTSGPQWLAQALLQDKWVLAVAGTHGKTTTSSMLAWILEYAGLSPGFLIGGVPGNFEVSARLGESQYFVIEADEYDTAFFDKRSKMVHYLSDTLILNNLEFDHADIFNSLAEIQTQFHHAVRTVPSRGQVVVNADSSALKEVVEKGCWAEQVYFGQAHEQWGYRLTKPDGSSFEVVHQGQVKARVHWALLGEHNVQNAMAAISAACQAGVSVDKAADALTRFKGVKRRLELRGERRQVRVYDDFAHHPTAIEQTLKGIKAKLGHSGRVLAVLEPRSNTMRMNYHGQVLCQSLQSADAIFLYQAPGLTWALDEVMQDSVKPLSILSDIAQLAQAVVDIAEPGDAIVVMSNGSFEGIHELLLEKL